MGGPCLTCCRATPHAPPLPCAGTGMEEGQGQRHRAVVQLPAQRDPGGEARGAARRHGRRGTSTAGGGNPSSSSSSSSSLGVHNLLLIPPKVIRPGLGTCNWCDRCLAGNNYFAQGNTKSHVCPTEHTSRHGKYGARQGNQSWSCVHYLLVSGWRHALRSEWPFIIIIYLFHISMIMSILWISQQSRSCIYVWVGPGVREGGGADEH